MTNKEAIKIINNMPNYKPWEVEALALAIKALEHYELSGRQIERSYEMEYTDGYNQGWKDGRKALEQQPKTIQEKQAESEKYEKAFDDGYKNGYAQARFDYEQQPCEDCISREEALKVMCDKCPMYNCVIGCPSYRHIEKLPSVTPKARWIPVSEKLPEEGEPILFSTKTGRVYEGAYFDLSDNRQWYAYKDENYAWNNVVTAWMPLPQPYKAESEE